MLQLGPVVVLELRHARPPPAAPQALPARMSAHMKGRAVCRSVAAGGGDQAAQGTHLVLEDWWDAVYFNDKGRLLKLFGVIC